MKENVTGNGRMVLLIGNPFCLFPLAPASWFYSLLPTSYADDQVCQSDSSWAVPPLAMPMLDVPVKLLSFTVVPQKNLGSPKEIHPTDHVLHHPLTGA